MEKIRYFLQKDFKIKELEGDVDLKDYKEDYIEQLAPDIYFIDYDKRKLKKYVRYMLNSKAEELKDMFIIAILILSVISTFLSFLDFKNNSSFIKSFAVQTIKQVKENNKKIEWITNGLTVGKKIEKKENIKTDIEKGKNDIELDKQKGGGWFY